MELTEVLREIRPCNTENPYIFISYSSEDKDLVWRDVLEFQRRGYNIWIDEKNLDKTQDSWRYNALPAIEDMDCELVVFYVSRHSLISEGCYLELGKTIEAQTQAIHFGPVKFIAVDVEEIGNIMEFSKTVYNDLRSGDLPKEQKQQRAIILDKFKKDFFNSNNEKVRIHPKNEVNRKMDYYEEILASFPDSTRIFPEHREEEVSAEEEVPAETAASTEDEMPAQAAVPTAEEEPIRAAVPTAEEPIRAAVPTAEEEPAGEEGGSGEIEMLAETTGFAEETVPGAGETAFEPNAPAEKPEEREDSSAEVPRFDPEPEKPENITHEEIVYQAMIAANQQYQNRNQDRGFVKVREVSDTQIKNALKKFAAGAETETLIGFCDTTISKNGKSGVLITSERLYSEMLKDTGYSLDLWKIKKVIYPGKSRYHGELIYEDNTCCQLFFSIYNDLIFPFLTAVTEMKTGIRPVASYSSYHVTKEMVKAAVAAANEGSAYSFKSPVFLKESQMRNAVDTYAGQSGINEIVAMLDTTLRGNGKAGFLVTAGRLYSNDFGRGDYVEFDNLKEAALDGSYVILTYRDGYRKKVYCSIYAPTICAFLKELVMPESA